MKPILALAVVSVLGLSMAASAADPASAASDTVEQSVVQGQVFGPDESPVAGVEVILRTTSGEEIARANTDASGAYSLGCVDVGEYEAEIVPAGEGFQGQKVVAPIGPNGLTVAWAVDSGKPALASATATGGPCVAGAAVVGAAGPEGAAGTAGATGAGAGGGRDAAIILGGTALAGGAGVGIAAGVGAFRSSTPSTGAQ